MICLLSNFVSAAIHDHKYLLLKILLIMAKGFFKNVTILAVLVKMVYLLFRCGSSY